MFYVYLLRSIKSGVFYTGMAEDIGSCLSEHNRGKSKFTKGHRPWELVYSEGPFDAKAARKREKELKRTIVKKSILEQLKMSCGSLPV